MSYDGTDALREHGVHSRDARERIIERAVRDVRLRDELKDRLDEPDTWPSSGCATAPAR